jgi:hypothetical protein
MAETEAKINIGITGEAKEALAELKTTSGPALPHDGWKSRKVWIGLGVLGVLFAGCGAALIGGYATFDQVADLLKWGVPSVLLPQMAALGMDKIAESKRP